MMAHHDAAINVVVNCAARKRMPAPEYLCLRSIKGHSLLRRLQTWTTRLQNGVCYDSVAAEDLYCGDAWTTVRTAVEGYASGAGASLWVSSAGYGLLHASDVIRPYSATFKLREVDSISITQDKQECVEWWHALCQWAKTNKRRIHSIEALAKRYSSTPLLIALSPDYLSALSTDIEAAKKRLRDPDLLTIVSSGSSKSGKLEEHFLPCDASLEHRFGGARISLNSRIIRHILETTEPESVRFSLLKKRFNILLGLQPKHRTFDRSKMTDAKLEEFIVRNLRDRPNATHSTLLRALRESNRACEQKRFRSIFLSVKASSNSSI